MPIRDYLEDVPQTYQDLLYDGRKLQAIKRVREDEGLSLTDAKQRIDAIEAQLLERFPDAYEKRGGGCARQAAVLLVIGAALLLAI